MSHGGLVLAAGEGRRFGGPKAVARLGGERLVDIAVRTLRLGGCSPVVVVSGAVELAVEGATVVRNPLWESGMGSSVRIGLEALTAVGASSAVVMLVDTPWVSPAAVRRVVASSAGRTAAIATYDGRRGHPVVLDAEVWSDVNEAALDDVGAKAWLTAHPEQVVEVDCTGLGDPRDVDRPADLDDVSRRSRPEGLEAHQP